MVVSLVALMTSAAYAKCEPYRANDGTGYQAGWQAYRNGTSMGGVYALILNYSPWVYPNSNVSAWTMLFRDGARYAQIGWWEYAYNKRQTFSQWNNSGDPRGYQSHVSAADPTGTHSYYYTLLQSGNWVFKKNGIQQNKVSAGGVVPIRAAIDGETHTLADQMPGGTMLFETFTDSNLWEPLGSGGSWEAFDGTRVDYGNHFGASIPGDGYTAYIWDPACST